MPSKDKPKMAKGNTMKTAEELQSKLDEIRRGIIFDYCYEFQKRIEAWKAHDMDAYEENTRLLILNMSNLNRFFDFKLAPMFSAICRKPNA